MIDESQEKMSMREQFHSLLVVALLKKRSMKPRHPVLQEFESKVVEKLDALKEEGEAVGFVSIDWLQQALWVVLTTHANLQELFPNDLINHRDDKWVRDYMDHSAKLLDVCNVLKERIDDLNEYKKLVQVAIHNLQKKDASYYRARKALMDAIKKKDRKPELERCSFMLRTMGGKLVKPKASGFLPVAIYDAKVTTIFLCGLVVSGLACKPQRPFVNLHRVSNQCLWASSLRSLQPRVKRSIPGELHTVDLLVRRLHCVLDTKLKLSIPDNDTMDGLMLRLHDAVEKVLHERSEFYDTPEMAEELCYLVASLAAVSENLERGLDALQDCVNDLFRLLLATRNALLVRANESELFDNLMSSKKYQFVNVRKS